MSSFMPTHEYLIEDHFAQHLRSIEIEKDGDRDITVVNGRKFNNFVVDIGGASLLTAFHQLQNPDNGVLVIDPKTFDISANLMVLIRGGEVNSVQEVFERFFGYSELTEVCELSIESYTQALARLDDSDWESRLYFQDSFVEGIEYLDLFKVPFADKVLCYYPIPDGTLAMQPKTVVKNGMKILKETGEMQIVTESMHWIRATKTLLESDYAGEFEVNIRVMPRIDGEFPLSVYDIAFSPRPRNTIELRHKNSN